MVAYEWNFDTNANFGASSVANTERFKRLNDETNLKSSDHVSGGYTVNGYDDIIYLDISKLHNPDSRFTLQFTIEDRDMRIDVPVNYLTFGYHVRGRRGTAITVGRDTGSKRLTLGTITETGVIKATPVPSNAIMPDSEVLMVANQQYIVTLIFDNSQADERKLMLFSQKVGGAYTSGFMVAASQSMSLKNFSITQPKIIIGSSAWTNEPDWNGRFDTVHMRIIGKLKYMANEIDDPTFVPGSPYYPIHVSVQNRTYEYANNFRAFTNGQTVRAMFYSSYPIAPSSVITTINGIAMTLVDSYIVELVEGSNGDITGTTVTLSGDPTKRTSRMFVYEMPVDEAVIGVLTHGAVQYRIDMHGNRIHLPPDEDLTTPYALQKVSDGLYLYPTLIVDRSPPTALDYEITGITLTSVSFVFHSITDPSFIDIVSNYTAYYGYTVVVHAVQQDDNTKHETTTRQDLIVGSSMIIDNLNTDKFYDIYAEVTDPAGATLFNVLPRVSAKFTSPVETIVDEIPPVITYALPEQPGGGGLVPYRNPADGSAGIRYIASVYDNTARVGRTFAFDLNIYNLSVSSITKEIIRNGALLTKEITANNQTDGLLDEVFQSYTVLATTATAEIIPDETYYLYAYAEDWVPNNTFSQVQSITIENEILNKNAYTESSVDGNVAQNGDKIHLTWTSLYKVPVSNWSVVIHGVTVTPTSNDNGLSWAAALTISSSHNAGPVSFSVTQTRNTVNNPVSFTQNDLDTTLYVENRAPTITSASLVSGLTSVNISSIVIDDYTITHNTMPFDVAFRMVNITDGTTDWTFAQSYSDLASMPSTFSATGLVENRSYVLRADVTNVYQRTTSDIFVDAVSTQKDSPVMNLVRSVVNTNIDHATVDVSGTSFMDPTSAVSVYIAIGDTDKSTVDTKTMLLTTTPIAVDQSSGILHNVNDFMSDTVLTNYIDQNGNSNTLMPKNTAYYLFAMATDGNVDTHAKVAFSVDSVAGLADSLILTNMTSPQDYFVRGNDTVRLSFNTPLVYAPNDFVVTMLGQTGNAVSSNGRNWTVDVVVPENIASSYYGPFAFELRVISKYIFDDAALGYSLFVDNGVPTGTLVLNQRFNTAFSLNLVSLTNAYMQQTPNTLLTVDKNFTVVIKAVSASDGTEIVTAPYSDSYTNVLNYLYRIEGLSESTAYTVTAHITNPAGTTGVIPLSTATTIYTKETELPVMTYTSDSFLSKPETTVIEIRNVVANDLKSDFSAYIAVFEDADATNAPALTEELFAGFVANGAGQKVIDRTANNSYSFHVDINAAVPLSSDGASWGNVVPVRYNTNYRARGLVVDASDNEFTIDVLFQTGGPPVVNYVPPVTVEDESGLSSVTSTAVAFVETDDGTIIGSDSSGGGNHVVVEVLPDATEPPLSTNAIVNAVSLNMGAVASIDFSTGVTLSDSFTYSTWFLVQTPIPDDGDGIDLVQSDGAALVSLTTNSVVVESGLRQEFAFTSTPSEWTNINVVSDGASFQVFVDGTPLEIISSNEQTIASPGSNIGLNTQAGLLIDDIRIYDAPLNTVQVQKVVQSGQKRLHLGFDTPSIPSYNVSQNEGVLMLNGANVDDILMMSANIKYIFYQYDVSNKEPLVFANKDGQLMDSQNVHYYLDNRYIGNDPILFTSEYDKSTIRRIEIYPTEEFRFGLYSDMPNLPYTAFVNQEPPKIINKANLDETIALDSAAPPLFVTDSAVGAYAASFPQGDDRSVLVPGASHSAMNHELFSVSAWIKTSDFGTNTDLPVISRKEAFELGVRGDTLKPYINLEVDVVMGFVGGIKELQYTTDSHLSLLEVEFTPPNKNVRYMVFATAQRVISKRNAFSIAESYEDVRYVYRQEFEQPTTLPVLELSYVIDDTSSTPIPISLYKSVYVYVLAIDAGENSFELGVENDFKEFNAKQEGNQVSHVVEEMRITSNTVEIDKVLFSSPLSVQHYAIFATKLSMDESKNVQYDITFDSGENAYIVNGEAAHTIVVRAGDTLSLNVQGLFEHPVYIKTVQGKGVVGSTHSVLSVSNNGASVGTLMWTPTTDGEYVYQSANSGDIHGTIIVEPRIMTTSFTESTVGQMFSNAGYSEGWNMNNAVYYSAKSIPPFQVNTLSTVSFKNAIVNLQGSESEPITSADKIGIVFAAKTTLGYTIQVHRGNYVLFSDAAFSNISDQSNRYNNILDNGRAMIIGYYTNFSEGYEHATVPVPFDFSTVGSVWEYELEILGDRSKIYPYGFGYMYMYFHGTNDAVRYNSDNVEGWAYFGTENASEWRTIGFPTWKDGTTNITNSSDQNYEGGALQSSKSYKWPIYHRITVVENQAQNVLGYANTRVAVQPNGHTLLFEFFEDAKRLKPVLSGTGTALTHYSTTNPIQYEGDTQMAYMTIGYEGQAPSGGGIRVSNFVRIL